MSRPEPSDSLRVKYCDHFPVPKRGSRHVIAGQWIGQESGYTIVESVVALALLVTVLVPASTTLSYFVAQKKNEQALLALLLGQRVMEETLHNQAYEVSEMSFRDKQWLVRRDITVSAGTVTITIRVYRRAKALVELSTIRRLR